MQTVPDTGVCPNCELASAFTSSRRELVWPEYNGNLASLSQKWTARVFIWVMTCRHCTRTATYLERRWMVPVGDAEDGHRAPRSSVQLIYPSRAPRELSDHVPEAVRSLFREASECENVGALRGAAGLYRAAVEVLCDEQGAEGKTLYAKLEALKTKAIDDQIIADLHEARLLGNFSLHDGMTFTAEEVADVAELLIEATTALYVQPAERRRLRDARKSRREA